MAIAQSAEFKKAIEDSRKLKAKPSDDELLQVCFRHSPKEINHFLGFR